MHRGVAQLQLLVGQAGALASEHEGHLAQLDGLGHGALACHFRQQFLQLHPARARGAAQHQPAVGHGLGQGSHHRGIAQHVLGAGRAPVGVLVQRPLGSDQDQPGQAHGFHRAGGGTDVARMLGTDQDEADA